MGEILGVLFAVMVSAYMLTGLMAPQKSANDTVRAIATAQQQKLVYAAGAQYLEAYANQVQSTATATNPVVLTVPMLQAAGMNVAGMTGTNPYGQTWQVQVLQPSPNNLQALVVGVGGDTLPDRTAALIARYMGAAGGIIPKNDTGIYANGAGTAYGNSGGWNVPTANYSGLAGGHPAALLTVVAGQVANNYLYRNAVPGQPQLNQMNTALSMAGNDINNIGTANANTANATTGNIQTLNSKQGFFSRDGQSACCNPNGATLSLSESTASTGRKPTIQFHSAGVAEGYVELAGANEPRRLNLRDNQGVGLGLDATGTISAPAMAVPSGPNVHMGSSTLYGDTANTVLYQDGAAYIQHHDGTPAALGGVSSITSTNGVISTANDWWSLITRDGSNNDNAAVQSAAGSIYVNDIYIRSLGKWASQLVGATDTANLSQNGYEKLASGLIIQWGYYPNQITSNGSYTTANYSIPFPHAVFNCSITAGYTNLSNDNGPLNVSTCGSSYITAYNTSDAVPVNGFYWMAIGW